MDLATSTNTCGSINCRCKTARVSCAVIRLGCRAKDRRGRRKGDHTFATPQNCSSVSAHKPSRFEESAYLVFMLWWAELLRHLGGFETLDGPSSLSRAGVSKAGLVTTQPSICWWSEGAICKYLQVFHLSVGTSNIQIAEYEPHVQETAIHFAKSICHIACDMLIFPQRDRKFARWCITGCFDQDQVLRGGHRSKTTRLSSVKADKGWSSRRNVE